MVQSSISPNSSRREVVLVGAVCVAHEMRVYRVLERSEVVNRDSKGFLSFKRDSRPSKTHSFRKGSLAQPVFTIVSPKKEFTRKDTKMVVLSNFLAPQEGVHHEEPNTTVFINDREVGKGTLYITESLLSWVNSDTQQGFSLEYPHITLHAVSRDEQVHPQQCLYIVVDAKVDLPNMPIAPSSDNSSENEDEEADAPMTEMRFVPDNSNNLQAMFQAMNECQVLHPDPQDSFSDAEEDIYEDAEEDDFEYYEVGAGDAPYILPTEQIGPNHNGTEGEEAMDIEAGQFEDAEEDP